MMNTSLDRLTIKGFKSIHELVDFELGQLNVIVGANGTGKSNLISFFKMLNALTYGTLNRYVIDNGGAADLLFNGRKITDKMEFETHFAHQGYRFSLIPTPNDGCAIIKEAKYSSSDETGWQELDYGDNGILLHCIYDVIASWQIYHFHDTSATAGSRHYEIVQDNKTLRTDAANIGPFLLKLREQHPNDYQSIINAIRLVTPFFDDFLLEPRQRGAKEEVNISWVQKGSDYPMQPYHLSDGTLRFICLATALLQPNPPSSVIIDEPELGLHPAAIVILAELIQQAAQRTQVIMATQSAALIDQFAINEIIVVNRNGGASVFERLNEADFSEWLQHYSVGELWTKNVIAGDPTYE